MQSKDSAAHQDLESVPRIKGLWDAASNNFRNKRHPDNFPVLPEIPVGRYTREDFFQIEKQLMWKRSWLLTGFIEEFPSNGSFKTYVISDIPVIVVRGDDGKIRAFYNVCQHRGSRLIAKASGTDKHLTCGYHCWSYDLRGRLKFIPDEHDFPGLDKTRKSLRTIRCESFGNMIFVNFDSDAQPLLQSLGTITDVLSDVPMENVHLHKSVSYELAVNWKAVLDNFSENYHVNFVHFDTLNRLVDSKVSAYQLLSNGHAALTIKPRESMAGGISAVIGSSANRGVAPAEKCRMREITQIAQRAYVVFPNISVTVTESQVFVLSIWPLSVNRTRADGYFLNITGGNRDLSESVGKDGEAYFGEVIQQDITALEHMQESMASGGIDAVRLGWQEQMIYNYNLEFDRVIGRSNIPAGLAVEEIALPLATST